MEKPSNLVYAVPIANTQTENCTAIYRFHEFRDKLIDGTDLDVQSTYDLFLLGKSHGPDRPFLGTRKHKQDGTYGKYVWKSFAEVEELILQAGSGLYQSGCSNVVSFPEAKIQQDYRFLGIFSKNREEWTICDYACGAFNIAIIPLYDTIGEESFQYILNTTRLGTIAASGECAKRLLTSNWKLDHLKYLIVFDSDSSLLPIAQNKNITLIEWKDLLNKGKMNPVTLADEDKTTRKSINTICYTSGTTGIPKGAIITHGNFIANFRSLLLGPLSEKYYALGKTDVLISYLPLAHVYERIVEVVAGAVGARIGYYIGDTLKLLDDIKALNPTIFVSVPRLYSRIYDRVMAGVRDKSHLLQKLFKHAVKVKLHNIRTTGNYHHYLYDRLIFKKIKALLGDRLQILLSGSAPLSEDVQATMMAFFSVPFIQGYGMTETLGGSIVSFPADIELGHIGTVTPSLEFRLESVKEMNYDIKAKLPRGELLIRGFSVTPGYFLNDAADADLFSADGWIHTGDIAELRSNGSIAIIDRKKNIFKLAQGEYVIPEKIEGVLSQIGLIEQIFVTGYSTESFPVAIVIPNVDAAKKWCSEQQKTFTTLADLCSSTTFIEEIENTIQRFGKQKGLMGFEIPKKIHLSDVQFSIENDCLTPSFKLKRPFALKIYEDAVKNLYATKN